MKIGEKILNPIECVYNYENLIKYFVSSIDFGISYAIHQKFGCNFFIMLTISYVFGILIFKLVDKILEALRYKESKTTSITLAIVAYLVCLLAWIISYYVFDYNFKEALILNVTWILATSIEGFKLNIYCKY